MSTLTAGVFLPCGPNVEPEPVFVEDYQNIQKLVGGHFDVVTTDCNMRDMMFVGYVNDEGLINGMEINYLATNLFKREIHGDVVVVWGLSPNGEYDGDNYDIPDELYETLVSGLTEGTAQAYNMAVGMSTVCMFAIDNDICTEEEVDRATVTIHQCAIMGDRKSEAFNNSRNFLLNMLDLVVTAVKDNDYEIEGLDYDDCHGLVKFCTEMKGHI